MKTFEQYIRESVDFRLGGNQQKGFEQTNYKSFAELKKGDKFYWFYKRNTLESCTAQCYTFSYAKPYEDDQIMLHSNKLGYVCINKEQYDLPVFVDEMHDVTYVASTDYDLFVDTVKEETGIELKETDIIQI